MNRNIEKIRQTLKGLGNYTKAKFKAEIIGIFGSYARGEQKKGSDLDILVRFHKGASLFDLVGLSDFLEGKLKVKVDVVSERAVREELKETIFKEAIAV